MSDLEQNKIEVGKRIVQWLNEETIRFQEEVDPYLTLKLALLPSQDIPILVIMDKQRVDNIRLVVRFTFSEQDKKTLAALKEKRIDFVRRLREAFLHSRVLANFYPDYNNIQYIEIHRTIYFDGLSKHRFFQYLDDMIRAWQWLVLEYERLNGSHKTNFLTGFVL